MDKLLRRLVEVEVRLLRPRNVHIGVLLGNHIASHKEHIDCPHEDRAVDLIFNEETLPCSHSPSPT